MRKKIEKNIISEMKSMLNNSPKLTLESVIFSEDEHEDVDFDNGNEVKDDIDDEVDFENDESENNMELSSSIKNEVDSIRKICLKTIARLANDSNSPEYEFMKKIWNLCDKATENKKENKM